MGKGVVNRKLILVLTACAALSSCTAVMNDFGSSDFTSFSVNGTYTGKLSLSSIGTTVPTDTAHFALVLSQQNGAVTGTGRSSGNTIPEGLAAIDDAYAGNIAYYANYFAHINGYLYPKAETLDQSKQNGTAIACDVTVNTLTNITEGSLFLPADSAHYVEILLTKQ